MPESSVNVKKLQPYRKDQRSSIDPREIMQKLTKVQEYLTSISMDIKEIYHEIPTQEPGIITMSNDLRTRKAWGFDMETYLINSHFNLSQGKSAVIPYLDSHYRLCRRTQANDDIFRLLEKLNTSVDFLTRQNRNILTKLESRDLISHKNATENHSQNKEVGPPTVIALSDPPPTIKAWACDMERYLLFHGYSVEQSLLIIPNYMHICYKIWFYDYCRDNSPVTIHQVVSDIIKVIFENVIVDED
ncbi:hypothetical protein CLU79DRAFT_884224 [Phycomyces nitens]|nr:hypothetical protein CLU79DRAFT_884224 [Phycomyces nitens]